jgi:hypothetical protein
MPYARTAAPTMAGSYREKGSNCSTRKKVALSVRRSRIGQAIGPRDVGARRRRRSRNHENSGPVQVSKSITRVT